jgi:hypothetical protein
MSVNKNSEANLGDQVGRKVTRVEGSRDENVGLKMKSVQTESAVGEVLTSTISF